MRSQRTDYGGVANTLKALGDRRFRARLGAPLHAFTGTARRSVQTTILHVHRYFLNSEIGTAEAGKPRSWGWTSWRDLRELWGYLLVPLLHQPRTTRLARCRADPVVAEAMEQAIAEATDESSRTATFIVWRTRQLLAERGQSDKAPSRATMFRLFSRLSAGRHTTGSAATRRGLAGRPQRMFSQAHPAARGELMEIDSTPLDVLVMLHDAVPGRVDLTGMIDVATRTVPAAVLRPSTRSVDASVLLARALTPEPMRPGWPASLAMARSALPYERLLSIDERLRHAAARPVICRTPSSPTTGRCSSPVTSDPPAGTWELASSRRTWRPVRTSRTSRRCSPHWPRCSASSPPATWGAMPTGGDAAWTGSRCGP